MNIDQIINGAYLLKIAVSYLKEPSDLTRNILANNDVRIEDIKRHQALLEYHDYFLSTGKANYPLLRQGLDEYFKSSLKTCFPKLGISGKNWLMIDYGSGNGSYSDAFLEYNPDSAVVCIDRNHAGAIISDDPRKLLMEADFEKHPDWFLSHKAEADMVLMSELLHCKQDSGQQYLVSSAHQLLKLGGILLVVENIDLNMAFRISSLKQSIFNVVTQERMQTLTTGLFLLRRMQTINNHIFYYYEKQ